MPNSLQKIHIAIVGASIAGSAAAILLNRLGFNIKVFEKRGPESMADLGAGLVLPPDLVTELKKQKLFDESFPAISLSERVFITNAQDSERVLTSIPLSALAINWNILYSQLAKCLPKDKVLYQAKATEIVRSNESLILTINQKEKYEFDYIIFADGYRSLGRKFLFPNAGLEFTDYTCWQGNFITTDKKVINTIGDKAFYYLYKKGILLAYAIPSSDTREVTVTWFLYELIDQDHPLLKDNKVQSNIYQNDMKPEYIAYLHKLAIKNFPPLGQEIVTKTKKPFTHAIYDIMVPKYVENRIVLMGDAGILLRPHLGSGATKALQDALSMSQHLQNTDNIDSALNSWGAERHKAAANLFGLSRAFGDFLVTDSPQWNEINGATLKEMWNNIAQGYNWYQHKSQ